MADLLDVARRVHGGEIGRKKARKIIAKWGTEEIGRHLKASGLDLERVPNDSNLMSDILLALTVDDGDQKRLAGPKTSAKLAAGELFEIDPPSVRMRFAYRKDNVVKVIGLHTGDGAPPRLVEEFSTTKSQLSEKRFLDLPEWDEKPITPDTSDPEPSAPEPIPVAQRRHFRIDVKMVYWIPFRRNTFPIPQRLLPDRWANASMTPEEDLAARAMLATGNPTPPDSFTKDEWTAFVASKEYRAILNHEFFACCPSETPGQVYQRKIDYGYTPAMSDISPNPDDSFRDRLKEDREDKQSAGSLFENMVLGDLGGFLTPFPIPLMPDKVEDALHVLESQATRSRETYSPGEGEFSESELADCLGRTFELSVRVGHSHNLLNYAATGKLVGLQGAKLMILACCSTGTVRYWIQHSAIPSKRLYINNRVVWEYDMLTGATWPEVQTCFYEPGTLLNPLPDSEARLRVALADPKKSPLMKAAHGEVAMTLHDGCPNSVPQDWIGPEGGTSGSSF